jgi:hypothetical protein
MSLSPNTPELKYQELAFLEIEKTNLAKYTSQNPL